MKLTGRLTVRQHIITLSGCGNCHVLTLSANKRSASNSQSLLTSLASEPEDPFLTNPFQLNTGTKTLLLVETLSPINGELGPCRQYWLLLLFCGLRPPRLLLTPPLESRSHPHTLTVVLTESCFNENQFYKCVQLINFNIFDIFSLAHLTHVPGTCI